MKVEATKRPEEKWVEDGLITAEQLAKAREQTAKTGEPLS